MKFRIWTILWVFALFASGMATFGGVGVLTSLIVIAVWAHVAVHGRSILVEWMIGISVLGILFLAMIPSVSTPRAFARRSSCANNMKQIALGLLNYESANGQFPAHEQSTPSGQHLHSWRLWISPYLESSPFYDQFDKNEAWDSPNNKKLVASTRIDWLFQCPSHPSTNRESHYLAVVGDRAAFPTDRGRTFKEFVDGMANTIMLIEASHKHVEWAKPEDLSLEEAIDLLASPPTGDFGHMARYGFFYKPRHGVNVAFADGSVRFFKLPIVRAAAEAMLTVDGGEEVGNKMLRPSGHPELDYARIYSLSVYVILSVLPVARLRQRNQPIAVT